MMDDLALIENMIDRARKGRSWGSQSLAVYDALLDDLTRLHKRLAASETPATTVDRVRRELAKYPASPPPMVLMYGNEVVTLDDQCKEIA